MVQVFPVFDYNFSNFYRVKSNFPSSLGHRIEIYRELKIKWKNEKEEKKNDTVLDILLVSKDHATETVCLVSILPIIVVYDYLNA